MLADSTPSTGPSLAMVGVGLLVLVLLVATYLLSRAARRANRSAVVVAAAMTFGAAVFAAACLASSFRHFGGTDAGDLGERVHICEAWWYQMSSSDGVTMGGDEPSPECRDAAVQAIPTVLTECGFIGAGSAVFAGGWIEYRRRRFTRALEQLSHR